MNDRTTPTLITLLVVGMLLMTFDIRNQGDGLLGVLRSGAQTLLEPLQRASSAAVDPVADFVDGLSDIASLREENDALREAIADERARRAETEDALARLQALEALYDLDLEQTEVARTPANVIGRPDPFDLAFQIDKGAVDGIVAGQPVVDVSGFVVGTVTDVSASTAVVVPMIASRNQVTARVGSQQAGLLEADPGGTEMRLTVFDAREPVQAGDQVITAANTFPAGLAIGEVIEDAVPESAALVARVRPFVDPADLRVVVVLAWPPDPISSVTTTTTPPPTTTLPDDTDTSGSTGTSTPSSTGGDG